MAFSAITPLVWLYASGYKIGNGLKVQKTGILILDSEPEGARISLNGESQEYFLGRYIRTRARYVTTPAKLKSLLPGEYAVRMELDGYWPWQKKLDVLPGQSTFAEDVILFKNELPLLVARGAFSAQDTGPDGRFSVAQGTDGAVLIDLEEQIATALERSATSTFVPGQPVRWAPSRERFTVGNETYLSPAAEVAAPDGRSSKAGLIDWAANDRQLVVDGSQLVARDLASGEEKVLFHGSLVQDILVSGGRIYILSSQPANAKLATLDDQGSIQDLLELPPSQYRFLEEKEGALLILDEKFGLAYLLEPASPYRRIRETINNCRHAQLTGDGRLLYMNEHEIWLLDLATREPALLARLGEEIRSALWHPNKNYVIFATTGRIAAIELDRRERYNITDLARLGDVRDPALSPDGDILYFLAKIGNQEGLYKLEIQ
jgi:hypothetical protein